MRSLKSMIIEDGVLVASNTNKEVQIKAKDSSVVYVSSSAMSLQDLKLELSDSATLQLTTDSITLREDGQFQAHDKSSITVLTPSLTVDDLDLDAESSGTICISATKLTASSYDGEDRSKISLPNASSKYTSTGTRSCDEASIPVPMAAWPQPPRSPKLSGGRFESDTAGFQSLGAFSHDSFLNGSGLEVGGLGLGLAPASGGSMGLDLGLSLQQPPLPMAPPPPPSSGLNEGGGALYHLQHQQQLHQQQELRMGSGLSSLASLGGVELGQQNRDDFSLGSSGLGSEAMGQSVSDRRGFNLSDAMLNLDLGGGMLGNEPGVLGGNGWGDPSASLSSASPSSASLRDQMNAQMAALYQHPKPSSDPPSSLSGGQGNSIHVSPEVTKPNDNIKVQVSLLAEECLVGRVLLVGLFRLGQPTNDKPIFVKQVLFENKLHRNYRFLNTRITFRAPRSPGEFEFRVFEDRSGHGHQNGKRQDDHHDGHHHGKVSYSNVTIARSNRLKACLEYSHFIDTLRATHDKFQQGVADGDAGLVLSALLALMRLVDQVETVFLHGHALLGDLLEACLHLLERRAEDIARSFTATETIPHPMETFHGTLRNVLNAIEANKYVRELVADDQLADIARIQRERFCQVSGLYFANDTDRCAFWLEHFGFAPIEIGSSGSEDGEGEMLHASTFVTRALTQWVEREAAVLMPERSAFRASRQSIYDQLHAEVISKLSFTCELDVFGSSANEFGNEHSDMDMCLVLPELTTPTVEDKQRMLMEVVARLEARPDLFTSVDTTRLTARIPIVMFVSRASGIECDLCVENRLAQRNTSLLRAYASADPRVRMLAYVIKRFVKQRRMNCAAEGTLSSYGYLLLLIHFLQRQDPAVLPVLQALPPNWPDLPSEKLPSVLCRGPSDELDPSASADGHSGIETYFYDPFAFQEPTEKLASLREYCSRNTQTVGELLLGFLRYYGLQFDATRDVVSVRRPDAGTVTKDEKRHTCQWRFTTRLSIEDPFEVGYDVAHVLKGSRDKYIRQQFVRAYVLLMDGAIQHQSTTEGASEEANDAVERIMSIVNEHVLEVPFLQAPHPVSPVPMPMPQPLEGF
ncbi:hypothetical protein JG688_00009768 [Phytophthora aleatoria]|uniref:PAP-associated domain-containing protein n=1 Tax=Phytophthora aleatoria TaxID=2496075 RepID=A0A8J5MFC7_9STRA|nr:hypothetical protein JG688_00009768 [Phytophthora aleatoria]